MNTTDAAVGGAKLDAISRKIRALLAKTAEAGCSEAEAHAAAALAQELLAKYQLSLSDLELRAEGTEQSKVKMDARRFAWWLASRTAEFCDCRVWGQDGEKEIRMLGLKTDAFFAEWLLRALVSFVERATLDWQLDTGESIRNRVDSFSTGCIDRINQRLGEEISRRKAEARAAPQSRALIVVKDQLVTEAFAKLGLNLRASRASGQQTRSDSSAYSEGHARGDAATFHRPMARDTSAETRLIAGSK